MKTQPLLTVTLNAEEFANLCNAAKKTDSKTFTETESILPVFDWKSGLTQRQRNHWRKLHTTRFTAEQLELWIQSIPGCSTCQRDFRKLLESNPPRFDDWFKWTWEVHNVVNRKLGKPEIAWEEACLLWGWDTTKETQ